MFNEPVNVVLAGGRGQTHFPGYFTNRGGMPGMKGELPDTGQSVGLPGGHVSPRSRTSCEHRSAAIWQ